MNREDNLDEDLKDHIEQFYPNQVKNQLLFARSFSKTNG